MTVGRKRSQEGDGEGMYKTTLSYVGHNFSVDLIGVLTLRLVGDSCSYLVLLLRVFALCTP